MYISLRYVFFNLRDNLFKLVAAMIPSVDVSESSLWPKQIFEDRKFVRKT